MPRRSVVVLALASAALVLAAASPAGAQTTVSGSFHGGTTRAEAPSCPGVICGDGTLAGFGDFTFAYVPESFEQLSRSCFALTATMTLTFASGDELVLDTAGTACWAGNAANAPGSQRSWGNPVTDSGSWTVASGTGDFAGASGDGTFVMRAAGAALHGTIEGTLELAG